MAAEIRHTSVLLEEAIQALNPRPGKIYLDGTLGGGGHARRLCEELDESACLIGIDQDPVALEEARRTLTTCHASLRLVQGNFGQIRRILVDLGIFRIDGGLLLDLGVSDFQIRAPERGFSFRYKAPLDMRMNPDLSVTAQDLVNNLPASELAALFWKNADEKLSRQIAGAIVKARPIQDTLQLASIAEAIYRRYGVKARNIHPATRIFQALRIAVNREIEMLEQFLDQLPDILAPGTRVALITFHSIEDRLVKRYFRLASTGCICPPRQPTCTCNHAATLKLIGKPIQPQESEILRNPQARSARLRVAEWL